jgi:hypothetical protein
MNHFESDSEKAEVPGEKLVPVPLCLFSCKVFINCVFHFFFFYSREYSPCNLLRFKTPNIPLNYSKLEKTVTSFALFVLWPEEIPPKLQNMGIIWAQLFYKREFQYAILSA